MSDEPKFQYGIRVIHTDGSYHFDSIVPDEDMDEEEFVVSVQALVDELCQTGYFAPLPGGEEGEVIFVPPRSIAAVTYRSTPYEEV